MKPHKHAEIIKAWADGAEIEFRNDGIDSWISLTHTKPTWEADEYRIKPQPKEPQYLYVFVDSADWQATRTSVICNKKDFETYIGKIKLEQDE